MDGLLVIVVVLFVILLFYLANKGRLSGICQWCPRCLKKSSECTTCGEKVAVATAETGTADEAAVLLAIANGCSYRLKGVFRVETVTADAVKDFLEEGSNRMVLITNIEPEKLVSAIMSGEEPSIKDIKASAISAAPVDEEKKYIVMKVVGGKIIPNGLPTNDLETSLEDLQRISGDDKNSLVFFIDEDVECPGVPKVGEKKVEKCCGKRWD